MTLLQEACKYAQRGWKVFPLSPNTKIPIHKGGFKEATDDIEQIIEWWNQEPKANIGIATGSMSGIWVLDIDNKGDSNGIASMKKLTAKFGDLPNTVKQRTPSGGWHLFFKYRSDIPQGTAGRIPGVDTRGDGGYIVAPPSIIDGADYKWFSNFAEPIEVPNWLINELSKKRTNTINLNQGSRNSSLTSIAGRYRAQGLGYEQILELLKLENLKCNPPLDITEVETIAASIARYEPNTKNDNQDSFLNFIQHVNPLGIDGTGSYVFYPRNLKCVKAISATSLMQIPNLYSIVGERMLLDFFPKIDKETGEVIGFNAKKAALFLMDQCQAKGSYNPDLLRGVGVWRDKGSVVVNTGAHLVVDGKNVDYIDWKTKYLYSQPGVQVLNLGAVASSEDLDVIRKIIYSYNWAKPYHAHLFLGAMVQAVIGSALRWRSHIWIIGAQGTGKSTLQASFIKPLLGPMAKNFVGETTAAGVRHFLKADPFTVCFDEAEVRSKKDAERMKDIIALARISSSDDNNVVKGSASGDAVEYRCQSCFIMSSIKPYLREDSDIARFAILELDKLDSSDGDSSNHFAKIVSLFNEIDSQFAIRWLSFCINSLPIIEKELVSVREKLVLRGLSPRAIDQYGQLIACALVVNPDINLECFEETFEETRDLGGDHEPMVELSKLLNSLVRIPSKYGDVDMTIRHAVELADKFIDDKFVPEHVNERLCSYGLMVKDKYLRIANVSDKIESILGSPKWNDLFKRIDWIEVGDSCATFGSRDYKSRYTYLPLDKIKYQGQQEESVGQQPVNGVLLTEKAIYDAGF